MCPGFAGFSTRSTVTLQMLPVTPSPPAPGHRRCQSPRPDAPGKPPAVIVPELGISGCDRSRDLAIRRVWPIRAFQVMSTDTAMRNSSRTTTAEERPELALY